MRAGQPHADLDFTCRAKGMTGVAEIGRADGGQKIARLWPHHAQDCLGRGHVGDGGKGIADVAAQPRQIALQGRPWHHQQERGFRQARHGQIGFDPAARVQHLRIDDATCGHVHVIAAEPVQKCAGVAPFDPDLAKAGHVEQAHPVAHRQMFRALVVEPVLPFPRIAVFAFLPVAREPVGALPSRHLSEHRTARLQVFVQRCAPHPARSFDLPVGEVIGIKQAQRFGHPFLQIAAVALKRLRAADVHFPQVERRFAFGDPMRQRHTRPARTRDPDRVVAGGDPVTTQFRRLAQIIPVVGGKAFRAVEKGMDSGGLEQRHPVHRRLKDGLKVVEIFGQAVETEIFGDARHSPWLGFGFKGTQHHLACVRFVIGAFIGHPQHRQMAKAVNRFGHEVEMLARMQRQRHVVLGRQITAPHAAAVDHHVGGDMAHLAVRLPVNARDTAT